MTAKEYLERDTIVLLKPDGRIIENIKATVLSDVINSAEQEPFDVGDVVIRKLPNGTKQKYTITSLEFFNANGSIPQHYMMGFHHPRDFTNTAAGTPQINIYGNMSGGGIYFDSEHSSKNNELELFTQLLELICKMENTNEKEELHNATIGMQEAYQRNENLREKYNKFMSISSDHLSIFGPLLMILSGLVL